MRTMLHPFPLAAALVLAFTSFAPPSSAAPVPEWIWHQYRGDLPKGTETNFVRKAFSIAGPVARAELKVCGDDLAIVFLNGKQAVEARSKAIPQSVHYSATTLEVTEHLQPGENLIAVQVRNAGGPYGLIAKLEISVADGQKQTLNTDTSWITSANHVQGWETPGFQPEDWTPARRIGQDGDNPWFEVMNPPTTTAKLDLRPGFQADLLREAQPGEGSWIAMAIDDQGRLIVSPQKLLSPEFGGMLRLTLDGQGRIAKEEKIQLPVGGAQGLLYAHRSLYVTGYATNQTPENLALYRVRDTNGDDQFDTVQHLWTVHNKGGSHGPHGLALGPDGMIYHISGDYSKVVDGVAENSPHRNFQEDLLLPREWDASGHARGIVAPMGHVQRTDPEGKTWELVAAGLRNPYDLDFNADGELFTFDADMEYDTGLPWYRPTRVYHLVSGGEYGHREGTGKWPYYYPDSLPPATDIGLGSPCGVKFGTGSKFPPKYQRALFMCDWAWGQIFAVHFTPQGASYTAEFELFASGRPLNAMDIEFGRDGAMYLITGGNDTQTGLYRITYAGPPVPERKQTAAELKSEREATAARALRRQLEKFHGRKDPAALDFVWPHLDSPDRWIRYAARIALEGQEVNSWQARALEEQRQRASFTALLALARCGGNDVKNGLIQALGRHQWSSLEEAQQLELLRIYSVAFARLGGPSPADRAALIKRFDPLYPAASDSLNRELIQLLVFLETPSVIGKTMSLLAANPSQEQQIHYIFYLRNVVYGWTLDQRQAYFEWFQKAAGQFTGGVSFYKFLGNFKKQASATLTATERAQLALYLKDDVAPPVRTVAARPFVKDWQIEELLPELDKVSSGRNFAKGRAAFDAAQCLACHRFGAEGGLVGPDLTAAAARFSRRDLLESIVLPSKIVMEQYQNTLVVQKDGDSHSGRIADETDEKLVLLTNPLTLERVEIPKSQIQARRASELSPMPEGLANVLSKEEILDLLAYMESGGRPNTPHFQK